MTLPVTLGVVEGETDEWLTDSERTECADRIRKLVGELTTLVAALPVPMLTDPGSKAGDLPGENVHRVRQLRRVLAGQLVGDLVAEVTAETHADEAANAVWLGASLAELGRATGITRQAARKRWPELGLIYRTRRWLGYHQADLAWCFQELVDHSAELGQSAELDLALAGVRAELTAMSADTDPLTADRWRRQSAVVDRTLRKIVEGLAAPTTAAAEQTLHQAYGVLAYYDHARAEASKDA